jgi:hypothetical protein
MSKTDNTKFVNPADLEFPIDEFGLTSELKRVFIATVAKLKGSDAKLKTMNETLAILLKHKTARFEDQKGQLQHELKRNKEIMQVVRSREQVNSNPNKFTLKPKKEAE